MSPPFQQTVDSQSVELQGVGVGVGVGGGVVARGGAGREVCGWVVVVGEGGGGGRAVEGRSSAVTVSELVNERVHKSIQSRSPQVWSVMAPSGPLCQKRLMRL